MEGRIAQWGNSLALRIPRHVARALSLSEGQHVELEVREGALTVRPQVPPRLRLEDLPADVTEENCHAETDWGPDVGREQW